MHPNLLPGLVTAVHSYHLPRNELRDLQDRMLRKTIHNAYESVPYYRELFRKSGLTPDDFRGIEDLRRIPLLHRRDIVQNYPGRMLAKGLTPALVRVSGGTTGAPMKVAFSGEFDAAKDVLYFRRLFLFGLRPWHRVVTIWDPLWRWRRRADGSGEAHRTTQFRELPLASFFGRPIPQIKILRGIPVGADREARRLW